MDKKNIHKDPMFKFLMVMTISSTVGHHAWQNLLNNFAVEIAGLKGNHIGAIQSIREIPGFLSMLVVYVLLIMKEHHLSAFSILLMGIGIAVTGLLPTYSGLIATTLIMSFGFHYYETTNQSLTLQYFDQKISPWIFGRQRSLSAASSIVIGVLVLFLSEILTYRQLFFMIGFFVSISGFWGLFQQPQRTDLVRQNKKMIFRRKYSLFYILTFLAGARRQIFTAFAIFLLVEKFSFSVREITVLLLINNMINYFLSPLIGKMIIELGERRVLSIEYLTLIFIFVTYALSDSRIIISMLFIIDNLVFNFAMAIRTYFQKIGDPEDIAPSMAVGFTINHIAAVTLPVVGGILWMVDYRIPFFIGATLSAMSLIFVQKIHTS